MKLEQKFLLILFLIISSTILSVDSRVKFSRYLTRFSRSFSKGGNNNKNKKIDINLSDEFPSVESEDEDFFEEFRRNKRDSLNLSDEFHSVESEDEDFFEEFRLNRRDSLGKAVIEGDDDPHLESNVEKAFRKVLNFILGMMQQIPGFTKYGLAFQGLIDTATKPECSRKKLIEEFYKPHITDDMKKEATKESIDDYLKELGDTEDIKHIDWTNPRQACKTVKKLHKEKQHEMSNSEKKSGPLLDFAEKVLKDEESFAEFESKIGGLIKHFAHLHRERLRNFILDFYFDGNIEQMKETYEDFAKWQEDLTNIITMLRENMQAAEDIKKSFSDTENDKISCRKLPTTNELQGDLINFSEQFIGGLYVLKQVTVCLRIDAMILVQLLRLGIKKILRLIANIFGLLVVKVIYFTMLIVQFGVFLYKGVKTDETKDLDKKYRFYGRSAGVIYNILNALLFK